MWNWIGYTFEAGPFAQGMDVGCGQSGPGVVGWREGKAVGRVVCQGRGERFGHSIFDGDGC